MWNRGVALRILPNLTRLTRLTEANRNPKKSCDRHSLEVCKDLRSSRRRGGNYSSMIPLFKPIIAAWVRSLAPNFERMFLTRLFTVSSVIES